MAAAALLAIVAILAVAATRAEAQTANQIGAWDGLVLSPAGALAPVAGADAGSARDRIALRYGRWRYDPDDAVHDNVGLTWTHAFAFAHARVSLTGVYSIVECPTCSAWASGGLDFESTLWARGVAPEGERAVRAAVGVRIGAGGARYLGTDPSTAGSATLVLPMTLGVPIGRLTVLSLSVEPGYGYGHVNGVDFASGGVLPVIGGAASLTVGPRAAVDIGWQRMMLAGAPAVVGAALSWRLR